MFGSAALVLDYPSGQVAFCVQVPATTHSVELLPGNRIAVADTTGSGGVLIYSTELKSADKPLQTRNDLPSSHGLLWDHTGRVLWAVGTNRWPQGTQGEPVQGILAAYPYDAAKSAPLGEPTRYRLPAPALKQEWGETKDGDWYDGPHDVVGVPGKRELLITTDLYVYQFVIGASSVEQRFIKATDDGGLLKGFTSHIAKRNELGIPASSIKSISVRPTGLVLVSQGDWRVTFADRAAFWSSSLRSRQGTAPLTGLTYKARWFGETPGWATAR